MLTYSAQKSVRFAMAIFVAVMLLAGTAFGGHSQSLLAGGHTDSHTVTAVATVEATGHGHCHEDCSDTDDKDQVIHHHYDYGHEQLKLPEHMAVNFSGPKNIPGLWPQPADTPSFLRMMDRPPRA